MTPSLSDEFLVWIYGGPLERDSARFDSGSFLVYLLFVGSVIVVSTGHLQSIHMSAFLAVAPFLVSLTTSHYLPVLDSMPATVPENEEDCPCILHYPPTQQYLNRISARCKHGGKVN